MSTFPFLPAAHLRPADFTRLASGDLPEREARKLRRHLSLCAQCRAKWQATQTVWQAALAEQTNTLAAPPDELRERIFAALPPARFERKPFMLAFLFDRPVAFASLAAAATVFVGVGALTYGPALVFHTPRAVAFEDVEAAMGGIKTATWKETSTITRKIPAKKDPTGRLLPAHVIGRRTESQCFLQVNPPRIAVVSRITACPPGEEASLRKTIKSVFDGVSEISFGADGRTSSTATRQSLHGDRFQNGEEMVRRALLFPRIGSKDFGQRRNALYDSDRAKDAPKSAWVSVPDSLNGKPVVRLQYAVSRVYSAYIRPKIKMTVLIRDTFWVDPTTYRIVRREMQLRPQEPDEQVVTLTCEAYRYNTELPADIFDSPKMPEGTP